MKRKFDSTTMLPASLASQLTTTESNDSRFKFQYKRNDRKQQRKEQKSLKKQKKINIKSNNPKTKPKPNPINPNLNSEEKRNNDSISKKNKGQSSMESKLAKLQQTNPGFYNLLSSQNLIRADKKDQEHDDPEIKRLEKKLKLKDGKLNHQFKEDGLDFLLGMGVDSDNELEQAADDEELSVDEYEEDLGSERGSQASIGDMSDMEDLYMEEALDNIEVEDKYMCEEEGLLDELLEPKILQKTKSNNSIYGDNFTQEEKVETKYVPPHLRKQESNDKLLKRLLKRTIGLLNKLSIVNILKISEEFQQLFLENPRLVLTEIIANEFLKGVQDGRLTTNDAVLKAGFIAILYHSVGLEFGAFLLTKLTRDLLESLAICLPLEKEMQNLGESEETYEKHYKKVLNFTILLAMMNTFKITTPTIMYSFIHLLLVNVNELTITLIMEIIKACGPNLRKQDPTSLKQIIVELSGKTLSPRGNFMYQQIKDLKNNKLKSVESITKMKKLIGDNTERIEGLNVTIEDILKSEKNGKWWLVGSSWKNADAKDNPLQEGVDPIEDKKDEKDQLLQLARQQRMNTDIRKQIFIVIMSSQDYIDAFQKLSKLSLKPTQAREIIKVIFHLVCEEKVYNKFYYFLTKAFIEDYSMKVTLKYTLWDYFKSENFNANVGLLFLDLLVDGSVDFTLLKTLEFTNLSNVQNQFMLGVLQELFKKDEEIQTQVWVGVLRLGMADMNTSLVFFLKSLKPRYKRWKDSLDFAINLLLE